MDTTIETLQDTFKIGYEAYEESAIEAADLWDMYHNRQYTIDQLAKLSNRGQPAETFNVVKLFSRMLLGYYSTVVNTVVVSPEKENSIYTAGLLNDTVAYTFRKNKFISEGDKLKLSALISGVMCCYISVIPTGEKDQFGRPLYRIQLEHVPENEIVLDPLSRKEDYSDARFLHRYKWVSEDDVLKLYGEDKLALLDAYFNHLNINEAEFEYTYNGQFTGHYKQFDNYLIVHTVITGDNGKTYSIHWCGDTELYRKEITYKEVKWNYRVTKLHTSNKTEYYGIFREVKETQKAINQALIKIQLMVNTQKVLVEEGSVEDIAAFTAAYNRVSGIIEVLDLSGIKIEQMSREILDQYTIIDKAFDRIQRILSINDSFLGMAFASDSGRKVKLQQNATITALRYLTNRIEQFYLSIGEDIVNLAKQYFTAEQVLRITDETTGQRWITLNKPIELFTGELDENNQPIMEYAYEQVMDPETGKPLVNDEGNYIYAPIPEEETEIAFSDVDISISTVAYNDEDEKNQLMLETILSGNIGQLLAQINPAGYFKAASLSLKTMKTKHSPDIAAILEQTSVMLGGNPEAEQQASQMAQNQSSSQQSAKSQSMKLPQNTNEGVG